MSEVKTTLGHLFNAEAALQRLVDMKLAAKVAVHVSRIVRFVGPEIALFKSKRLELYQKFGTLSDDGKMITLKPEHHEEFNVAVTELAGVEVVIPHDPLTVDDLADQSITSADIMVLGVLIKD